MIHRRHIAERAVSSSYAWGACKLAAVYMFSRTPYGCAAAHERLFSSVSLAAVVHVRDNNGAGPIKTEKDPPFAHTQAIPAFQRTFQSFNVSKTGCSSSFQGADNTFCIGAVHAIEFPLSSRPVDQQPLHKPSRRINSP